MKITLTKNYKSLRPFESEELTPLTVITGKNGSGKTQLLNLIISVTESPNVLGIQITPELNNIQLDGIVKSDLQEISYDVWKSLNSNYLNRFKNLKKSHLTLLEFLLKNNLENISSQGLFNKILDDNQSELNGLCFEVIREMYPQRSTIPSHTSSIQRYEVENIHSILFPKELSNFPYFLREISIKTNKSFEEIEELDFFNTSVDDCFIDENNLFTSKIELIFYNYAKRRDTNRRKFFDKEQDGDINNAISDREFTETFPPPWETINNILEKHSLDYEFEEIARAKFSTDVAIQPKFLKKSTHEVIPFNDLSSGEKVIIGLILKLFTSEHYKENLSFPELLLLDEPDAHLHPEMSYLLINVLEETFVKTFGTKVIFTTHSPSTIALVNEENIYQITNGINTSLKRISKDEALKMLTSFIPTLTIDYKNHKQVFVESPTDRNYYQTIFDRHNQAIQSPIKLYFVSNGYGKGNSSQVKDTVNAIRATENSTFWGIIDWDKTNKDAGFIKVHGENSRYSLENYLYDPIYIVTLLLEIEALNIHSELEVDKSFNQYDLYKNQEIREKAINWFFQKLYEKFRSYESKHEETSAVKFLDETEYKLPTWYLEYNGHHLETMLKEAFAPLNKYIDEGDLQIALTKIAAKCYPFVHLDTIEVFNQIVNG